MKQRFYLDTSVFGGVFDKEFDEFSLQLFERINLGKVLVFTLKWSKQSLLKHQK